MGWRDGGAKRAGWRFANFANVVSAAGGTRPNLTIRIELNVRRQVAGEIDAVAIRQVMFQSELIRGGINLAEVVDARSG